MCRPSWGGSGGPGTNPEQLFAVGYAACFQSALLRYAAGRKLDLSGSHATARVGIGDAAQRRPRAYGRARPRCAPDQPRRGCLAHGASARLVPVSRAMRGNIEVTLSVNGATIEREAA
jgi:organic hydroperoxide reductase OsmC/OhrA